MRWSALILLLVTQCVKAAANLAIIATSGATEGQQVTGTEHSKYGVPGPEDLVRKCNAETCPWDATMVWVKFKNLRGIDFLDTCLTNIAINIAAPSPWNADADPCKAWKPQAKMIYLGIKSNGGLVSWGAVTNMVNGDAVPGGVTYEVYRGDLVVGRPDVLNPDKPLILVATTTAEEVVITKQPTGLRCYAIRAVVAGQASLLSGAACKTMTLPAPSDGSISAPTDGSIVPPRP
jgi:hypothetical protein